MICAPSAHTPSDAETSVGTFDVPVALFYKVEKPVHRVEDVPSVGEADKGLHGFDAVPLDAGLVQVAAPGQGDIVEQLDAGVVVFHRYEEWHAEAIAVPVVHAGVREGATGIGVDRTLVGARPVLAGELESEFIDRARREKGYQAAVEGVRPVFFYRIGAARPGVHVEGAVFLFRPRVVVF